MKILLVMNGGFGDASWTTSWPRIFSERGHEIDVFLMKHTGNPYHANPFIRKMYEEEKSESAKKIKSIIDEYPYDFILIPDNTMEGMVEVAKVTKNIKNVHFFKGAVVSQIVSGLEIPPLTKPEWYFTKEELKYVEDLDLRNAVLFHPLSSSTQEESRNISFDLIVECSKKLNNVVVIYGGRKYLPIDDLKRMEIAGIRLLWEDYNCFNDGAGSVLGKFLALTSQCQASVHGWSGSFTMSMGFNKPYVMVVPGDNIRANKSSPYESTKTLYEQGVCRAKQYGCLNPSSWCITNESSIIVEAIKIVQGGKTALFNKQWTLYGN